MFLDTLYYNFYLLDKFDNIVSTDNKNHMLIKMACKFQEEWEQVCYNTFFLPFQSIFPINLDHLFHILVCFNVANVPPSGKIILFDS